MTDTQITELEGFVLRIYDLSDNAQLSHLDPNYANLSDNDEKFSSLVALLHDFVDFPEELEQEESDSSKKIYPELFLRNINLPADGKFFNIFCFLKLTI